jgi:hypothetical protein
MLWPNHPSLHDVLRMTEIMLKVKTPNDQMAKILTVSVSCIRCKASLTIRTKVPDVVQA